jgi:hypothetical protein
MKCSCCKRESEKLNSCIYYDDKSDDYKNGSLCDDCYGENEE